MLEKRIRSALVMGPVTVITAAVLVAFFAQPALALDSVAGAAHSGFRLMPYTLLPTGNDGNAVEIGDVTGDGRSDVVMTTTDNDYSVYLYAQGSDGVLEDPVISSFGGAPNRTGIALVDLDGVNGLDVVVGTATGLSLLRANATGGLADPEMLSSRAAYYIEALDLDGNGTLDLASTTWSSEGSIHLNQGNGGLLGFDWPVPVGGYNSTASGDLDGDSDADMAVASAQSSNFVFIYRNIGDGGLQLVRFLRVSCGHSHADGIAIADFNSDGLADVAVSSGGNLPNTCVAIYHGEGTYQFSDPVILATDDSPGPTRAADLNGDGLTDLIVLHNGVVGYYLQQENGMLAAEVTQPLPFGNFADSEALAVGDINSDRCADVAYANDSGLVTFLGAGCDQAFADGFEN